MTSTTTKGPLAGIRVIELGGMGPGPFAGMTLGDMGAEVIRVERPGGVGAFPGDEQRDTLNRGKQSVVLDLKDPAAVEAVLAMIETADVLIEGHRPGVTERLGLGPEVCLERKPSLVYGRMTGWGQTGPLATSAGHDVDYIAITGALHAIGPNDGKPSIPLNLVGDFGGGGMYLVSGILAALIESKTTGTGQVVDAAIVDGTLHLLSAVHGLINGGAWKDVRGDNFLDGAAPYYGVYDTADGQYMAVGAIESKFYRLFVAGLGVDVDLEAQEDRTSWVSTREKFAAAFKTKTQNEWVEIFTGTDACVAPVMSLLGAQEHPHIKERGSLLSPDGLLQAAPAPRFSNYDVSLGTAPPALGEHTENVLRAAGVDPHPLLASGAAYQRNSA
ncbi:CaiB/BaiF CoA transferase family protein [Rhodococcus erythropolis]|uniref:CaiB/BaiF CoA transferase family protein n=1 Tax=Rhodococcus erythropolis TaxID=1833 RepID=UPI002227D40E|nr:CaiB/BaiF CoA-transferase family protein [Rhodococcus erythropolis]MCW2295424.1 alpha-methylacyl-CoA racemase [Rhodococcus erythropolis]